MDAQNETPHTMVTTALRCTLAFAAMSLLTAAPVAYARTAQPPPPGSTGEQYTGTATYMQKGGTAAKVNRTFVAKHADQSGVMVTNGGTLKLTHSKVRTSGDTMSSDESSFYGLNAGVLAKSASHVTLAKSSITTSGSGANGAFATGSGSWLHLSDVDIKATGGGGHGIDATQGASIAAKNATISTAGQSAADIATDRGGGTVTVAGGTMQASGYRSPGIYSTGKIVVSGAKLTATGAEGAVVEGGNSINLNDTFLKGTKNWGVMLYNSMSGDAAQGTGTFTMEGGSLTAVSGPAFYVTNAKADITLKGSAHVVTSSRKLVLANSDGTGSGNAGPGHVLFKADEEALTGRIVAKGTSTISAILRNHTVLKDVILGAALHLDGSSRWIVTANSALTSLTGATVTGSSITNIVGHGHMVTYDKSLAANKWLGGKTYKLADGGKLVGV